MSHTTFVAIRHGSTHYNRQGWVQGQLDIPLDEEGVGQALALRPHLEAYAHCPAYSSDLERAQRTATLALSHGEITLLTELRERDFGTWQGGPYPPTERNHPDALTRDIHHRPGGGESYHQLWLRGIHVFQHLAQRHPDETVLIFSHGGLLRSVISWALGLSEEGIGRFAVDNTGISIICLDRGIPRVQLLNDTGHLRKRGRKDLPGRGEKSPSIGRGN